MSRGGEAGRPEQDGHGRTLLGAVARFPTGLVPVGDGAFAWLQPNGDLGESNAGLICGDGQSLLVDTLWDLRLTGRMLAAMSAHTATAPIRTLVTTHADGDHCWGSQLLGGAEIVAAASTGADLRGESPRAMSLLVGAGRALTPLARWRGRRGPLATGAALADLVGQLNAFRFAGIRLTPPSRTFSGELSLDVGGRRVDLLELGPAHTPGDTVVHLPDADVVFTGDLLFAGVAPIMWAGPVENWIAALDRILALQPRVVVPGHGPLVDVDGVRLLRSYWTYVAARVRQELVAGADPVTAARRILDSDDFADQPFAAWDAQERLVVSAAAIARSDRGHRGRIDHRQRFALLTQLARLARERRARPGAAPR